MAVTSCSSCSAYSPNENYIREQQKLLNPKITETPKTIEEQNALERSKAQTVQFEPDPSKIYDFLA